LGGEELLLRDREYERSITGLACACQVAQLAPRLQIGPLQRFALPLRVHFANDDFSLAIASELTLNDRLGGRLLWRSGLLGLRALAEQLGKTTTVSKDYPGFLANRILMPMINEAFYALMEGVGSAEDIDTTMKLGTNQPMGPLTLADFIGLDVCVSILDVLKDGLGDDKYRACPLLRRLVHAQGPCMEPQCLRAAHDLFLRERRIDVDSDFDAATSKLGEEIERLTGGLIRRPHSELLR
jgi:hypothetical protein